MNARIALFVLMIFAGNTTVEGDSGSAVRAGLDVLLDDHREILAGKRIGVIANQTSVTRSGTWILDAIEGIEGLRIAALFTPEHGLDLLDVSVRSSVPDSIIVDLYGNDRSPKQNQLENLDLVVYDIQDLGCRFYTYISTMILAMDACARAEVKFLVLDRPDPLGGLVIEGPLLDPAHASFVGMLPVPVRYGLTPGELATFANERGYLPSGERVDLQVIPLDGWRRTMTYEDTGLPWTPTSPNMPDMRSALLYPGLCFLEGTNLSEGRGTDMPFRLVGAPWFAADEVLEKIPVPARTGVSLAETTYTPVSIPGKCGNPKYRDEPVRGLTVRVDDGKAVRSVRLACSIIFEAARTRPDEFSWIGENYIDRLTGTDEFRTVVDEEGDLRALLEKWERDGKEFLKSTRPFYLYED